MYFKALLWKLFMSDFFKKNYKDKHRIKVDTKQSKLCILKLFIDYRIAGGKNKEILDYMD